MWGGGQNPYLPLWLTPLSLYMICSGSYLVSRVSSTQVALGLGCGQMENGSKSCADTGLPWSSSQLLSDIEKLRSSMIDNLNASNVFYKKRIEELGQRLQEQNKLIVTQRHQV